MAASETRICIYGETGTGKELAARTLHEKSPRAHGPFVTLNCAAVPAELIESELFGHEKGAFTGAHRSAIPASSSRRIAARSSSTRSATCRCNMQAKLLRVLEEGEIERLGGDKPITVSTLACSSPPIATWLHWSSRGNSGTICIIVSSCFPITLPPLRRKGRDIPGTHRAFRGTGVRAERMEAGSVRGCSRRVDQAYSWPGNVRELRNMVERLLLLATGEQSTRATVDLALPPASRTSQAHRGPSRPARRASLPFEREAILTN